MPDHPGEFVWIDGSKFEGWYGIVEWDVEQIPIDYECACVYKSGIDLLAKTQKCSTWNSHIVCQRRGIETTVTSYVVA